MRPAATGYRSRRIRTRGVMSEWTVGQEVRVFDVNGLRLGQPSGGWPGEVVKVGRKLFHVRYARGTEAFRLETGRRNDLYEHCHVETVGGAIRRMLADSYRETLRRHGFELRYPSPSLAKLEAVATLLETMGGADDA